jgi:hypothetical protein
MLRECRGFNAIHKRWSVKYPDEFFERILAKNVLDISYVARLKYSNTKTDMAYRPKKSI